MVVIVIFGRRTLRRERLLASESGRSFYLHKVRTSCETLPLEACLRMIRELSSMYRDDWVELFGYTLRIFATLDYVTCCGYVVIK